LQQSNTNILQSLRRNKEAKVGENGIFWMTKKDRRWIVTAGPQNNTKKGCQNSPYSVRRPLYGLIDGYMVLRHPSDGMGALPNPNPWLLQNEGFPTAKNAATLKNREREENIVR
jgi:hypothetical protein